MSTEEISGYDLAASIAQLEAQGFLVTGMTVEKANGFYSIHFAELSKNPPNPRPQLELIPSYNPNTNCS